MIQVLIALAGMVVGILRDIARAEREEDEFDWRAWVGERPFQLGLRLLATLALFLPAGSELAQTIITEAGVDAAGAASTVVQAPVSALIGLYGDRIGKTLLGKVEEQAGNIPVVKQLFSWGKNLT